jgi:hypothetical protein
MISATQNSAKTEQASALGAEGFISKPLDPLKICDLVDQVVGRLQPTELTTRGQLSYSR